MQIEAVPPTPSTKPQLADVPHVSALHLPDAERRRWASWTCKSCPDLSTTSSRPNPQISLAQRKRALERSPTGRR
jgi:hypothetical protein